MATKADSSISLTNTLADNHSLNGYRIKKDGRQTPHQPRKRIIVYTFIYEGAAQWAQTDAVVKVSVPGNEDIIVKMDEQSSNKRFCAIASIEIGDDNSLEVQKLVTFHDVHSDCDRRYGWGFNYAPGSKE